MDKLDIVSVPNQKKVIRFVARQGGKTETIRKELSRVADSNFKRIRFEIMRCLLDSILIILLVGEVL